MNKQGKKERKKERKKEINSSLYNSMKNLCIYFRCKFFILSGNSIAICNKFKNDIGGEGLRSTAIPPTTVSNITI